MTAQRDLPVNRRTTTRAVLAALAASMAASVAGTVAAETVISIESWRAEDQAIWDEQILPAFEAAHPDIDVQFKPTSATEYNAALNARLAGGTAGDIITCRPFDNALAMHDAGSLAALDGLPGLEEHFSDVARAAWSTDDGAATLGQLGNSE